MRLYLLSWRSIASRPLQSLLSLVAIAAAIGLLSAFSLILQGVAHGFAVNAQGIDAVAGAKGSPLQLVLSSVHHLDVPAANIAMADVERLRRLPQVRRAVPLALGDNYKGFRIVGTTADYLGLYGAEIERGRVFSHNFEVVAGAETGLVPGQEFAGAHGFAENGDVHGDRLYKVVGILQPTGRVIDRLVVTPYQSVQEMHDHGDHGHGDHGHADVTAVLLQLDGPLAKMNLPRIAAERFDLQVAVPSYEIARLAKNLGLGRDLLAAVGGFVLLLAALMLFSSLAASLSQRRYDLAVMRVLGAGAVQVSAIVLIEGLLLAIAGAAFGILTGHAAVFAAVQINAPLRGLMADFPVAALHPSDLILLVAGAGSGALAALVPAIRAARADIAQILAQGR